MSLSVSPCLRGELLLQNRERRYCLKSKKGVIKVKILKRVLFILFISTIFFAASSKPKSTLQKFFIVLRIVDGDTIVVSYHGKKEHVRLLRINTPEKDFYGYKQAKKAMKKLVAGKGIRLEFENTLERDKYGRILAYVWVDDLHVNVEMVRLGWSRFWTRSGEGKYAVEFRQAEKEAMEGAQGLWSIPDKESKRHFILQNLAKWYQEINKMLDSIYRMLKRLK